MKFIQIPLTVLLSTLFISCGENTTSSPIADIASISIDKRKIVIYSTDLEKKLTATATYTDGTTANATADLAWSSSDYSTLLTAVGSILAAKNGGDANLTIDYADTFSDFTSVHINKLISIEYGDVNISKNGEPQVVAYSGTFEAPDGNKTNISLLTNLTYYPDTNTTLNDINSTHITFTINNNPSSIFLRAILFTNTENSQDFNTTFN